MLTTPAAPQRHRSSNTALVAWGAAASLGLLFMKTNSLLDLASLRNYTAPVATTATYVPLAAAAVALVAWHLAPRRAWAWLLLAGGALALPGALLGVAPGLRGPWMFDVLPAFTGSAPVLTMVGVLGAATVVWRSGARAAGAALVGTALVVQLIGPVVIAAWSFAAYDYRLVGNTLEVIGLVVAGLGIAGALVAILATGTIDAPARPDWRVTAVGGLAPVTQVLLLVWTPGIPTTPGERPDYFLHVGLVLLAIGLVIAAAAGAKVLLATISAGLLLGAFGMLVMPSVEVLRDIPVIGVIAAIASTVAGYVVAMTRWRGQVGLGGLAFLFTGLVVMYFLFNSDMEFSSYEDFTFGATPVLLVVGVVAAVCAGAMTADALAGRSATPAVLAGATTPLSLGTIAVIAHFALHKPEGKAPLAGLLPPTALAVLLATVALVALVRKRAPEQPPVQDDLTPVLR